MLAIVRELGFKIRQADDPGVMHVRLALSDPD
jgi:hypothetical protein